MKAKNIKILKVKKIQQIIFKLMKVFLIIIYLNLKM